MSTFLKRLLQTPREQRLAELKSLLSLWKYSVLYSVEGFILLHVISQYGFEIRVPFGISMQPTMAPDGEAIFIDKTSRRGRNVKVGDIVAFTHPVMETHAVKRIVALPGDFVLAGTPEAQGGSLEGMMIQVPKGHCFVAGDNQHWSRDSRTFGPLPMPLIRGVVRATLWPPSSLGFTRNTLQPYNPEHDSDVD